MIRYNKSSLVGLQIAMVFKFCVRPTSKRWFLIIVRMTMNRDPFDAK